MELHDRSAGSVVSVFVFHVLLSLMVLAWAHTCFTDPGVPPEWWQRRMAALAAAGQEDLKVRRNPNSNPNPNPNPNPQVPRYGRSSADSSSCWARCALTLTLTVTVTVTLTLILT